MFAAEAEQEAAGISPTVPLVSEWPSDDSADEDFDPEREHDSGEDEDSDEERSATAEGRTNLIALQIPSGFEDYHPGRIRFKHPRGLLWICSSTQSACYLTERLKRSEQTAQLESRV